MKTNLARRTMPAGALALVLAGLLSGCGAAAGESATSPSVSPTPVETPGGAAAAVGDYQLTGFWIKESSLDLSAGFGTITNNGTADDALVGVSAPGVPAIELHQTLGGVMQQVESFPVPAGGSLVLSPGANHLMLVGLADPLSVGEEVELALRFASGGTASILAPVEPFSGDDGHGHAEDTQH